jgi:hypothetical protein
MIGTRPIVSVNFPLKGLEIPAVNVNKAMISPLYSAPPSVVRYAGKSGISMLKLAEKSNELKQSKPKGRLNMGSFEEEAIIEGAKVMIIL